VVLPQLLLVLGVNSTQAGVNAVCCNGLQAAPPSCWGAECGATAVLLQPMLVDGVNCLQARGLRRVLQRPAFKGVAHFDTHASGGVEGRAAMRCGGVGTQREELSCNKNPTEKTTTLTVANS